MAKVLLVNSWSHPTMSLKPRAAAIDKYLPLNLIYIATALDGSGHRVRIVDPSNWGAREVYTGDFEGYGRKEKALLKRITKEAGWADVVGFSTSYFNWIPEQWLMNIVALANPRIFVGGWGSQRYPGQYLKKTPALVVVCGLHGEGLSTVPDIVPVLSRANIKQEGVIGKGEVVYLGKLDEGAINDLGEVKGIKFMKNRVRTTTPRLPEPLPVFNPDISRYGLSYSEYRNARGELVLPVVGSTAGCPYSMEERACSYCAQHTYLKKFSKRKKFREIVGNFDPCRVVKEIESAVNAASKENEKFDWIFFVDDSMGEKNFLKVWDKAKEFDIPVIFSTRPDYLTESWISFISKNSGKIRVNLGLEFFNAEDVGYTRRAPKPARYVEHNKKLVHKLLKKGIKFRAFAFVQGTRKWKNMNANISGILDLIRKGVSVRVCPTPLADFTELEDEAEYLETEHYLGMRIPGFLSYSNTTKSELGKIYRGLDESIKKNREMLLEMRHRGGIELLGSMRTLRRMARQELTLRD